MSWLVLVGCAVSPWQAFPNAVPPDRSCRTGTEVGFDLYVWNCVEGVHVVVGQESSAFFGAKAPVRQTSPCGTPTALEYSFLRMPSACRELPAEMKWQTTSSKP